MGLEIGISEDVLSGEIGILIVSNEGMFELHKNEAPSRNAFIKKLLLRCHAYPKTSVAGLLKEYSQRAIADLVQRPLKTVNRIIQAHKNEGRIADAPHNRRPRVTTADQDQTIVHGRRGSRPFSVGPRCSQYLQPSGEHVDTL